MFDEKWWSHCQHFDWAEHLYSCVFQFVFQCTIHNWYYMLHCLTVIHLPTFWLWVRHELINIFWWNMLHTEVEKFPNFRQNLSDFSTISQKVPTPPDWPHLLIGRNFHLAQYDRLKSTLWPMVVQISNETIHVAMVQNTPYLLPYHLNTLTVLVIVINVK